MVVFPFPGAASDNSCLHSLLAVSDLVGRLHSGARHQHAAPRVSILQCGARVGPPHRKRGLTSSHRQVSAVLDARVTLEDLFGKYKKATMYNLRLILLFSN